MADAKKTLDDLATIIKQRGPTDPLSAQAQALIGQLQHDPNAVNQPGFASGLSNFTNGLHFVAQGGNPQVAAAEVAKAIQAGTKTDLQGDQATQAGDVGQVVADAATAPLTPYGYNPDTSGIQTAAMNNPFMAQLGAAATGPQPYQQDIDAARLAALNGSQVAGALATPGSYVPRTDSAISAFGDSIGKFDTDTNYLRDAAAGKGPSQAAELMKLGMDNNARNMVATAAGARGGNIASGLRTALNAGAAQGLQGSQQIAALRAQEMIAAQQGLTTANTGITAARGNLLTGTTQAAQAETARQAAAAVAASQATTAATGVADTGVTARNNVFGAINNAGQQYGEGVRGAVAGYVAGGNVAKDAATDLEDQKRRALNAATMSGTFTGQNWDRATREKMQADAIAASERITPAMVTGGTLKAGGDVLSGYLSGNK